MKNVKLKFTVKPNSNLYYATSLKAISNFSKKFNLTVTNYYNHIPTEDEKKSALKCYRGIYVITKHLKLYNHIKEGISN